VFHSTRIAKINIWRTSKREKDDLTNKLGIMVFGIESTTDKTKRTKNSIIMLIILGGFKIEFFWKIRTSFSKKRIGSFMKKKLHVLEILISHFFLHSFITLGS
jgi:hypothetical protein